MSRHPSEPGWAGLVPPGWTAQAPALADRVPDTPPPDPEIDRTRSLFVQRAEKVEADEKRDAAAHLALELRWAAIGDLLAARNLANNVARVGALMWIRADDTGVYRGSLSDLAKSLDVSTSLVRRLARALSARGWATRRPNGGYIMHRPSVEHVRGTPGSAEPQVPESGTPGSGKRNPRFRTTPPKGGVGARALPEAAPAPQMPPAKRHTPDEAERARVAALIEQAKQDRAAKAVAKAERLELE
jgi:hypothetical protein